MSLIIPVIKRYSHADRKIRRRNIANDVQSGMTVEAVSEKYDVSSDTVRNACREFGYFIPRQKIIWAIVLKELMLGYSQITVARNLRVSRQRVSVIAFEAKKAGII